MSFTVLSDLDVQKIFGSLSPSDVGNLTQTLENALIQYSTQDELQYQPHRSVVARPDGQTSIYMPASTPDLIGVKIVGINPAPKATEPGLKSVLTLCDARGQAVGTLNAAALTAFRTALGSMVVYRLRRRTENVVVFGAGKQALWHVKLAVLLRGEDVRSVTVVNRSRERTQQLVDDLTKGADWPAHVELKIFDEQGDRDAALEKLVASSDAIFCTTPSKEPLFPASYLTSEKSREKTHFISAIGSYQLDMQEIDPEYLKHIINSEGHVVVDTREGCLHEAGELVKAGITGEKMLEIGQIFGDLDKDGVREWLEGGEVVYKSVGTGVMDLAIGRGLLGLARERGVGYTMEDF